MQGSTWKCIDCSTNNSISKSKCTVCSCFRSKSQSFNFVNGDWRCSNKDCREINFMKRETCRKCNKNKRILHELWCYEQVNEDRKTILLFYEDYKCNRDFLSRIKGNKTSQECVEYIWETLSPSSEYSDYKLIIEGFKLKSETEDILLSDLLRDKLGERVEFRSCYCF